MPSRSPFAIRLTVQERAELEARCKEYTLPHRDVAPLAWPNATAPARTGTWHENGLPNVAARVRNEIPNPACVRPGGRIRRPQPSRPRAWQSLASTRKAFPAPP
jgi:hypothetical protein